MVWSSRASSYKIAAGAEFQSFDDGQPSRTKSEDDDDRLSMPMFGNEPIGPSVTAAKVASLRGVHPRHSRQSPGRILRRLVGYGAALLFIQICASACVSIWDVLKGKQQDFMGVMYYQTTLMLPYVGTSTIRESPLVIQVLQNDTTPRNSTIYMRNELETSMVDCGERVTVPQMYSNEFQRQVFMRINLDTQYNLTFLNSYELVAPVIDCTFTGLLLGDPTATRLFFVLRSIINPEDVRLLTVAIQTTDYELVQRNYIDGASLLATAVLIDDLQATEVEHHFILSIGYPFIQLSFQVYEYESTTADGYWVLSNIPASSKGVVKQVKVACRQGIYINNERDRSNTANLVWELSQNPLQVVSEIQFIGRPTLRNAWAWVHMVHLFLVLDLALNLLLLFAIASNHLRHHGQLWVGDAFVVLNSRLWMLLPIVLVSWCVEGFWSLAELCIHDGNAISQTQSIFIYQSIMRADLMLICVSLADGMGRLAKERIEPALALVLYYVIFECRLAILQWSPHLTSIVTTYTDADYYLAIKRDSAVSLITPMRLWSVHALKPPPGRFVVSALAPILCSFVVCITAYIIVRKVVGRVVSRNPRISRASSSRGTQAERLAALTLFEAATGTELGDRFGVVSDYENFVVVRSSRFAAADAVYSSGFLIVNGRLLIQTEHIWAIGLMMLLRVRFAEVYAYEVADHVAQECALLVEPKTLSLKDLLRLDISALA